MNISSREIRIVRRFKASPPEVFEALISSDAVGELPLPAGIYQSSRAEARKGSSFIFTDHQNEVVNTGWFLELDYPRLIVYSLSSEGRVIIEIAPAKNMSEVALTHVQVRSDRASRIEQGWLETIRRLEQELARSDYDIEESKRT